MLNHGAPQIARVNVFWLDEDPRMAARYHCDQHVSKLLVEAAQLLSTAARAHGYDAEFLYRPTHENHPLTKWVGESLANWLRVYEMARALDAEYRERFGHDEPHGSWAMLRRVDLDALDLPDVPGTEPPQCVPEAYRRSDLVDAYRTYYASDKAEWAEWNHTEPPPWLAEYRQEN